MERLTLVSGILGAALLGAGCGKSEPPAVATASPTATDQAVAPAPTAPPATPSKQITVAKPAPPPEGVILPDEDADSGPAVVGVAVEIEGEPYCAKEDLKISTTPELAIQTADRKVYVIDGGKEKFGAIYQSRSSRAPVKVKGAPFLKEGQLHLSANEVQLVR